MNNRQEPPQPQQTNPPIEDNQPPTQQPPANQATSSQPPSSPATSSQPHSSQPDSSPATSGQPYGQGPDQQRFNPYGQTSFGQPQPDAQPDAQQWASEPRTPYGTPYGTSYPTATDEPPQPYGTGQQVPPQGLYYPPMPYERWNMLCIIGFILSFFIAPVGLILSVIALVQINRSHEKSKGMAIAGIVVGAVETVLGLVLVALMVWGMSMYMDNSGMMRYDDDSTCTSDDCPSLQSGESASHTIQYTSHGYRYTVHAQRL